MKTLIAAVLIMAALVYGVGKLIDVCQAEDMRVVNRMVTR